jgi:tRNA nucleotidyltransferase (CCA-adding enzyme)
MADLNPPAPVLGIAKRLEAAGYETWCVGGAVRDVLLGQPHLDWDLATAATPQEVRRLFKRTVPIGLDFGTVGVLDQDGAMHEVTTFRRDVETDGRHAVVKFGATIDEDLARRDFTLNAIAYHPATQRLHDPFGGVRDIERRVVRAVGVPDERMREDRLRALRAIRFAARFGFDIEPVTWSSIVASAPHLGRLSAERVKQELEKTMEQVERPSRALRLWKESGALATLIPPLANLSEVTLGMIDLLPQPRGKRASERRLLRLAALFQDLDAKAAERVARQLKFSNEQIRLFGRLIPNVSHVVTQLRGGLPAPAEIRRWIARSGRTYIGLTMRLVRARLEAQQELPRSFGALYREILRAAYRDPVELGDLAVDGDDLRRLGVAEGPEMGWILHRLLDLVLDEPHRNTVDELQRLALDLLRRYRAGER